MAAAAFFGCFCTGHGCWPPRIGVTFSTDVFVNGIPAHRMYDVWLPHCCPADGCHPGIVSSGAGNVYINGREAARMGDDISCGSMICMGSPNVDFGAPMSALGMISGALGLAGSFGISVPSFGDVLGDLGIDLGDLDVTGWVSENLFNGAVLPADVLSITEGIQDFVKNGSLMDLASFANTLTQGGGIAGTLNLGPLNILADAAGLELPQVVGKLEDLGITVNSETLTKALRLGINVAQNGLSLNSINGISDILGFDKSVLGLPDLDTILRSHNVELTLPELDDLTGEIDMAGANNSELGRIIEDYTGLEPRVAKNVADMISNISINYVESKLNRYVERVPSALGKRSIKEIINQLKTNVTVDIKDKTGGVIFL